MSEKMIKVNCSICGDEMDCPENMIKFTNNHICGKCTESPETIKNKKISKIVSELKKPFNDMGVCIDYSDKLSKISFPSYLLEGEFSKLSREELAKQMFFEGIATTFFGLLAIGKGEKDLKEILEFHKIAQEISKKVK